MRKYGCAALFAACLATAPTAFAGDFFINGQLGRMNLESDGFDDDERFANAQAGDFPHAEELAVRSCLSHAMNNVSKAAKLLGVSRVTLYRMMDKYGVR